jgi:hypothetical protein
MDVMILFNHNTMQAAADPTVNTWRHTMATDGHLTVDGAPRLL